MGGLNWGLLEYKLKNKTHWHKCSEKCDTCGSSGCLTCDQIEKVLKEFRGEK